MRKVRYSVGNGLIGVSAVESLASTELNRPDHQLKTQLKTEGLKTEELKTQAPGGQQLGPLWVQHLQNGPGEGRCELAEEHVLFISLAAKPVHYVHGQDGKTHSGLHRRGDMLITPAGMPLFARWENDESCLQIRVPVHFLKAVATETLAQDSDRLRLQPAFQARHPQIESVAMLLLNEYQQGALASALYAESLATALAVNLLRAQATTRPPLPVYEGGLPQRQMQQILDYVDAHLAEEIKLTDLARLLDMSQYHFSRMFKQALGISPYQYLLQQRVERAKALLKGSDRLITEIALDCGFNSHSHLSRQFRQATGMTPKAYRTH